MCESQITPNFVPQFNSSQFLCHIFNFASFAVERLAQIRRDIRHCINVYTFWYMREHFMPDYSFVNPASKDLPCTWCALKRRVHSLDGDGEEIRWSWQWRWRIHYNDVIMGAIASQIISPASVYSTVYLGADQRKHQSSATLAFVWGIHRGPVFFLCILNKLALRCVSF